MSARKKGPLILIGGAEQRAAEQPCSVLEAVARCAQRAEGALTIVTVATRRPREVGAEYTEVFERLGVPRVNVLDIRTRAEAFAEDTVKKLERTGSLFFTGGDQLRITSQLGGSPVLVRMREIHEQRVGLIAATSAGTAAAGETMIYPAGAPGTEQQYDLHMAPGLGLVREAVFDSHFAQRGRIARLLGAVTLNPQHLGVGIDEDTAIRVDDDRSFEVIGRGCVCIVDGGAIRTSGLSEGRPAGVRSVFGITLHMLAGGDRFDLETRTPHAASAGAEPKDDSPRRADVLA